ncbi:adhesion G-protein coupled receptor G6-like isoform X1 [Petromyzon marinus]|uniref:adhesion G-protein coupled receptor G6-like isoform X1 n=1 Tax=Petromyzon marinus TaxID=7757 RepID=UPI003F7296DC
MMSLLLIRSPFLFLVVLAFTQELSFTAVRSGQGSRGSPGGCRNVLRAPSGGFTSPGYPSAYPASARCRWELRAPRGFVVQLTFSDFQLESQGGCLYDNMTLLDSDGRALGTFCGITANHLSVNSTGSSLTVLFHSDFTVFKRGFSAVYRQVASNMLSSKALFKNNSLNETATSQGILIIKKALTVCVKLRVAAEDMKPRQLSTVFSYQKIGNENYALGMEVEFPSNVHFFLRGLDYIFPVNNNLSGGHWHKLCVTANTSYVKLFLNGTCVENYPFIQRSPLSGNGSISAAQATTTSQVPGGGAGAPATTTAGKVKTNHGNTNAPGQIKKTQPGADTGIADTTSSITAASNTSSSSAAAVNNNSASVLHSSSPLVNAGGILYLGRGQNLDGTLTGDKAFKGELYAFRLWGEAFNESAVESADCESPGGALVDWVDTHWNCSQDLLVEDHNLPCGNMSGNGSQPKPTGSAQTTTSHTNCTDGNGCITHPNPYIPTFEEIKNMNITADNVYDVAQALYARTQKTGAQFNQEQLQITVDTLQRALQVGLVQSNLASTMLGVISNMMDAQDSELAAVATKTLHTVDSLSLSLNVSGNMSVWATHLLLAVAESQPVGPPRPIFFGVGPQNQQSQDVISHELSSNLQMWVQLPAALLQRHNSSRAHFNLYSKTGGLFPAPGLVSPVIAATIGNESLVNLTENVTVSLSYNVSKATGMSYKCVFWNFNKNGGPGWSQDGCEVISSNASQTTCSCNHLTHFGILLQLNDDPTPKEDEMALTFITYIGCGVSSILLAITLLTHIAFEKLRRDFPSRILMNLCAALLLLNLVFLLDPWLASLAIPGLCVAVAALLHYALLASFTWMGLEALHMYIALVKVFNTYIRRYILKFCIAGWGIPAVVVSLVLAIQKDIYGLVAYSRSTNSTQDSFCWFRHNGDAAFYVTVVAFLGVVLCINLAMFVVVLVQICSMKSSRGAAGDWRSDVLRDLKGSVSLTFLLGLTWIFAFFAWGPANLPFMYLFCILNTLQGTFIFVFHCAMKENVRKHWRRYLCCGRCRLPDNSDWSRTGTNYTKKPGGNQVTKSMSSNSTNSSQVSTGPSSSSQSCLVVPRRKSNAVRSEPSSTMYDNGEPVYSSIEESTGSGAGQHGQPLAHLPRGGGTS